MIKALLRRATGFALALIALPLAAIAFLKGVPPPFSRAIHPPVSPFWHWVWTCMPAIRIGLQKQTASDLLWSAPGFIALVIGLIGFGIAFGRKKSKTLHRWQEDL